MSKQKYPQTANSVSISNSGEKRSTLTIKRNGYTQVKAHAKQDRKRREAYTRQDKYDGLTIVEKFNTLVAGGSKKQRTKLEKQFAKAAAKGVPVVTEPVVETKPVKKTKKTVKS